VGRTRHDEGEAQIQILLASASRHASQTVLPHDDQIPPACQGPQCTLQIVHSCCHVCVKHVVAKAIESESLSCVTVISPRSRYDNHFPVLPIRAVYVSHDPLQMAALNGALVGAMPMPFNTNGTATRAHIVP
jgi:hypothetical protein